MGSLPLGRQRELESLAENLHRQLFQVHIPLRHRMMYWLYYVMLAHYGVPVESETHDAQYADGWVKRGYDKYSRMINERITRLYPEVNGYIDIPTFNWSEITFSDVHLLMDLRIPFVLRGGAADLEMRKWTIDYLETEFGNYEVPVNVAPDAPDKDTTKPTRATQYYDFRIGTLGEVARSIRSGGNLRLIATEDVMHQKDGKLINELNIPFFERLTNWENNRNHFLKSRVQAGRIASKQLFLQPENAYTIWHCEPADNFFMQSQGRKAWTLAHPYHSAVFKPRVKKNTTYQGSNIDVREPAEVHRQRGYDAYTRIPKLRSVLEPGDILRLPNYWWHTVETLPGSYTIAATLRAPCVPNLTSPGFLMLRLLDKDYHEMAKRIARGGRVTDRDINLKIFAYLDRRKNRFE